jgi:hypothetical protein
MYDIKLLVLEIWETFHKIKYTQIQYPISLSFIRLSFFLFIRFFSLFFVRLFTLIYGIYLTTWKHRLHSFCNI